MIYYNVILHELILYNLREPAGLPSMAWGPAPGPSVPSALRGQLV